MLANFVQETANNPGTATTINLAGPASGRRGFVAVFGSGATVDYVIDDGTQYEYGIGVIAAGSPNTLQRTTVIENSAGTTARLNFTGAVRVYGALSMTRVAHVMVEAPRVVSSVAQADFLLPGAFRAFKLRLINVTSDAVRNLHIRFSTDGGSSFVTGASYSYAGGIWNAATSTFGGDPGANLGLGKISNNVSGGGAAALNAEIDIDPGTASRAANYRSSFVCVDATTLYNGGYGGWCTAGAVTNALRIFTGSAGAPAGTFTGTLELMGLR
ncbi:hypothetical protein [Falsiroseomonas sp. HW251]|uniref:hypothetical protein n=1 Tax=Falsiroseomonas sp. HW251 TaxID=3390998 RepID=UPI003D315D39